MTFRECGLGSLPELLFMLISVALGSYAVAFAWIEYIDDFYEPGEVPNINAATQVLGLIVGFLFVGLIRESKDQWRRTMETANDFMLTTHSMVLEAKREQTNVLQPIRRVRETVRAFYVDKTTRLGRLVNLLCCRGDRLVAVKVQACLAIREKMDDLQRSIPASNGRLRSLFSKLEGLNVFDGVPIFSRKRAPCFTWASPDPAVCLLRGHCQFSCTTRTTATLRWCCTPSSSTSSSSCALLSSVFQNPITHPELSACFEALNREIMGDVRGTGSMQYLRTVSAYKD